MTQEQNPLAKSWAAYAAAAWAFIFAAISFYWAAGGTVGLGTLAESIQESARENDPKMLALTWATGALKLVAGFLAIALAQSPSKRLQRRLLLLAGCGAGAILTLYGAAGLVEMALIEAGALGVPESVGEGAVRWYLLLWEPFWLLGGVLFLAATYAYHRRSKAAKLRRDAA